MKEPWELRWRDYYRELGIEHDASDADVHAAFRALARVHHPDRHLDGAAGEKIDAERRFKVISESYDVLRDPARRAAYDEVHARSIDGAAPLPEAQVAPEELRVFSWNGDFVVRSHVTLPKGAPESLLSVECDHPRVELRNIALRACVHGRQGTSDAVVRGRVGLAGMRAFQLEYALGRVRPVQQLRVFVVPQPILWFGRLQARSGWPALLAVTAIVTLLAVPLGLSVSNGVGAAVIFAAVCQLAYALLAGLFRFVRRPGWLGQLRPSVGGRWGYLVAVIVVLSLVRLGFRVLF